MSDYKDFMDRLGRVLSRDRRYSADAYLFLMAALGRAIETLETPRHVTGQELLRWVRQEAEEQFGPMAATVFEHWGIKNSLDFGHIVFNMVGEGILSKTDTDTLEDFQDSVFFENLFDDLSGYRLHDEEDAVKDAAPQGKDS
jgi:uncharacterized repeat protein (TIGR04138 family)